MTTHLPGAFPMHLVLSKAPSPFVFCVYRRPSVCSSLDAAIERQPSVLLGVPTSYLNSVEIARKVSKGRRVNLKKLDFLLKKEANQEAHFSQNLSAKSRISRSVGVF